MSEQQVYLAGLSAQSIALTKQGIKIKLKGVSNATQAQLSAEVLAWGFCDWMLSMHDEYYDSIASYRANTGEEQRLHSAAVVSQSVNAQGGVSLVLTAECDAVRLESLTVRDWRGFIANLPGVDETMLSMVESWRQTLQDFGAETPLNGFE